MKATLTPATPVFASRDELLTRLIIDSYERLGAAVEAADASFQVYLDIAGKRGDSVRALRTKVMSPLHAALGSALR